MEGTVLKLIGSAGFFETVGVHSIDFMGALRLSLEIVVPSSSWRDGNAIATVRLIDYIKLGTPTHIHANGDMQNIQSWMVPIKSRSIPAVKICFKLIEIFSKRV